MNKVILEGRIGRDPEVKFMPSGAQMTSVSLATSNDYKDKSGEWIKKPASWHNLVAWGDAALALAECRKGDIVHAEGKIEYSEWTDKEGQKRTGVKIVCFVIERKAGGPNHNGRG